jgi:hypothetical protein
MRVETEQVDNHLPSEWGVHATISAMSSDDATQGNFWSVLLYDKISQDVLGYHQAPHNRQPFAVVKATTTWETTCSHEILEMLVDPTGNQLVRGPTIHPDATAPEVDYLVEVCDACQDSTYPIDGINVADFLMKREFFSDPTSATGPYSYRGNLHAPRSLTLNGYLAFHDPDSNRWYQAKMIDGEMQFFDMGFMNPIMASLREQVDASSRQIKKSDFRPGKYFRKYRNRNTSKVRPHPTLQAVANLLRKAKRGKSRRQEK